MGMGSLLPRGRATSIPRPARGSDLETCDVRGARDIRDPTNAGLLLAGRGGSGFEFSFDQETPMKRTNPPRGGAGKPRSGDGRPKSGNGGDAKVHAETTGGAGI